MRILLDTAFNRMGEGRQGWCRECFRTYFKERGQLHLDQNRAAKLKRVKAGRDYIDGYLDSHPCSDCGNPDREVLEFDHVGVKRGNVATLAWEGQSLRVLEAEVAQCDVVCANCHRRRTAIRGNHWRVRPDQIAERSRFDRGVARNQRFVRDVLMASSCYDCGEKDIVVLEFHHLGGKLANVADLVKNGCGLPRLRDEIAKCSILCANCHRIATATERKV